MSGLCPGTILAGGFFAYSHSVFFIIGSLLGVFVVFRFIDSGIHIINVKNGYAIIVTTSNPAVLIQQIPSELEYLSEMNEYYFYL